MIIGADRTGHTNLLIVELKQWDQAEKVDDEMLHSVRAFTGGAHRVVSRPSYQAYSYAVLLREYSDLIQREQISVIPCAYLHNYEPAYAGALKDGIYQTWYGEAPFFIKTQTLEFRSFIKRYIARGPGSAGLPDRIDHGGMRPSKALQTCLVSLMEGRQEFILLDENQRVTSRDIGSVREIRRWAEELHSEVTAGEETTLVSQFRCNGSGEYLQLVDNFLRRGGPADLDVSAMDYDVQAFDDPNEMRDKLRALNAVNHRTRMVAGYCYDWNVKHHRGDWDIRLKNGFQAKWNLDGDTIWGINPDSFEQVGCIHTAQGIEFDYAGVFIGKDLRYEDFDWDAIFAGAAHFHLTGITPALSKTIPEVCLRACEKARALGLTISCDLNYRKNLWTEAEARACMTRLMPLIDVLTANEEDAEKVLGIKARDTDVTAGRIRRESYVDVAGQICETYGTKMVAVTLRRSISASDNEWSAMLYTGGQPYFSRKYSIHLVDRVGGGDSFTAGLLYGLMNEYGPQETIEYAAAASCLKQTMELDFNLSTAEEVKRLAAGDGSGRVQR